MQIIKDIYLDFYDNHFVNVTAKQNDAGRYIRAEILKDGTSFEIPADAVVSIASGTIWNHCEVEGNKIVVPLSKALLNGVGERLCQIEIVKGEEKLTTISFKVKVEKSVRDDGAIEGATELGILDKAISDAKQITQEAETAEAARKTAESARVSAENTRKSQETGRVNAEASRVSAEKTRKSQETTRGTAETARVAAENTRKSQETGRVNAESARVTEFASLKAESEDATARAEAAAAGDISNKTVTYTESTAAAAPASGSKLSAISGWLIGKVKNLVTRMGTAETSISQLYSNLLPFKTIAIASNFANIVMSGRSAGWMQLLLSINGGLYYVTCAPANATSDLTTTSIVQSKLAGGDTIIGIQIAAVDDTYFRLKVSAVGSAISGAVILFRNFSILSVS